MPWMPTKPSRTPGVRTSSDPPRSRAAATAVHVTTKLLPLLVTVFSQEGRHPPPFLRQMKPPINNTTPPDRSWPPPLPHHGGPH